MNRFFVAPLLLIIGTLVAGGGGAGAASASATNGIPGMGERSVAANGSGLAIQPGELNLGLIGPGEGAGAILYLKRTGVRNVAWALEGPEGWILVEGNRVTGIAGEQAEPVRLRLDFANEPGPGKIRSGQLFLSIEAGGARSVFRREIPVGPLRETLRFGTVSGSRSVDVQARLTELAATALLQVSPLRVDLGTVRPGEEVSRRLQIVNRGRDTLKWRAGVTGAKGMPADAPPPSVRFHSFRGEAAQATGTGMPAKPLPDGLELHGNWEESDGYPVTQDEQSVLRYRFNGTGISLVMQKTPEGDPLLVYLDQQLVTTIDGFSSRRERVEIPIAEGLPDAVHLLTLVNGGGRVVFEGVRITGKSVVKAPRGWVSVFPDSGVTTRETDYVTISLNTAKLAPGVYGDRLFILSNGGDADIELVVEVAGELQVRLIDVHRFQAGTDYFYTTTPQEEAARLQVKGYRSLGVAFRLFGTGAAGTTEFYRWYNPTRGDHYYSTEPSGGKPLPGYLFEGTIGNIATVRLPGTRELYRWFNPATGRHFYTTDSAGEGIGRSGYRFDGIAGYVR